MNRSQRLEKEREKTNNLLKIFKIIKIDKEKSKERFFKNYSKIFDSYKQLELRKTSFEGNTNKKEIFKISNK